MGVLNDVIGIIKDIPDASKDLDFITNWSKSKKYSSISKQASTGILQFPTLVSGALDIETAQNISKALERNYATFAQIVFSMSPTQEYRKDFDTTDYIRKFHQNTGMKTDRFDALNSFKEILDNYNVFDNGNFIMYSATYESVSTPKITAMNKEQLVDMLESVRTDVLNNKYIPKPATLYNFNDSELNKKYNSVTEAKNTDQNDVKTKLMNNQKYRTIDLNKNMLTDNDVKKSNELVATVLHVRIRLVNKDDVDVGMIDFNVGIKCTMHVIKSAEMVTNLVAACKNNNKVFNFIRWYTGEISFFKDFLLNVKDVKTDVSSRSKGASHWWITLKRRKALSKIKDAMFVDNRLLPNATIVVTAEEVEYIKAEYGYDLMNQVFIDKIMQAYFLLGFVVVDNSTQIAHFMFDGHRDFQSVTFSALEKANTSDEKKFKDMLKVMNRI